MAEEPQSPRQIGRYAMYGVLASGGMATVHLGRLAGAAGFARTVAIKALRPQYAEDPEFVSMFIDEARLAARIHHPNVVPTLDVVSSKNELFTVMDYVHGETLARLMRASRGRGTPIPLNIISAIMRDVLNGLHAAHESSDEHGKPLNVVHRDVSPQNVIVGADGVARVLDFGVAKAAGRIQTTREGEIKGKLAYMAPEQYSGSVSRLTDVFAASVVLWETIAGDKLFGGENEGEVIAKILQRPIPSPREKRPDLPVALEEIVMRGLSRDADARFPNALEMANALALAVPPALVAEVGEWVASLAAETLSDRETLIREMETEKHIPSRIATVPAPKPDPVVVDEPSKSGSRGVLLAIAIGVSALVILVLALSRGEHTQPMSAETANDAAVAIATTSPTQSVAATTADSSTVHAMPPPTSTNNAPLHLVTPATATTHQTTTTKPAPSATQTIAPDHI
jgi:serine/threonine-protein kinase